MARYQLCIIIIIIIIIIIYSKYTTFARAPVCSPMFWWEPNL